MYTKIIEALKISKTIAIFIHINPDGDATGSSLAMYTFLKKAGKTVHCFSPSIDIPIPKKFLFLKNSNIYNKEVLPFYDITMAVDCAEATRIGDENFKIFVKGKTKIVIDHHETHSSFAPLTLCEERAASTTQIIYKVLKAYDNSLIDKDIASMLYTGIVTDSGSFSYSNTSSETHNIASELLEYGLDVANISRTVQKDVTLNVFKLTNRVLTKTQLFENNQIALINFGKDDFEATSTTEADTDGLINNILNIDSVEIAISVSEVKDKSYKVSFRTKDRVSAASLAKAFGGGGHAGAAGCRIYGYYEDVFNKLMSVATEMLKYA